MYDIHNYELWIMDSDFGTVKSDFRIISSDGCIRTSDFRTMKPELGIKICYFIHIDACFTIRESEVIVQTQNSESRRMISYVGIINYGLWILTSEIRMMTS